MMGMNEIMSAFAKLQKRIAKLTGAQIDKLAELSGVSATTIHRVRYNYKKPRLENIEQLQKHIAVAELAPARRAHKSKAAAADQASGNPAPAGLRRKILTQPPGYGRVSPRSITDVGNASDTEADKAARRAVIGTQLAAVRRGGRASD